MSPETSQGRCSVVLFGPGPTGLGHQTVGVAGIGRDRRDALYQACFAYGVGARCLDDCADSRDPIRWELERATETGGQVPGMTQRVDRREVHDDRSGELAERRL